MNPRFVGGGNHWRVLPLPGDRYGAWQVYRLHWDRWEPVGLPYLSRVNALTNAHQLARAGHEVRPLTGLGSIA